MAAPVGPRKVKRYSDEFKIQAVKLASHPESGRRISAKEGSSRRTLPA
jgi:transposase-like protein